MSTAPTAPTAPTVSTERQAPMVASSGEENEEVWLLEPASVERKDIMSSSDVVPCRQWRADDLIEHVGMGRWNWQIVAICGLGNAADAVELMMIGYIMPQMPGLNGVGVDDERLALRKGWLAAGVFIGMLLGGILCGCLADKLGRRFCLLLSLGVTSVFGLLSATMSGWEGITTCRVLAGFGIGGAVPAVFALGIETVPREKRGLAQNLIAANWTLGTIFTAILAWIVVGHTAATDKEGGTFAGVAVWRIFTAAAAIPSAVCFALTLFVLDESPRFLLAKGQSSAAIEVLNKACRLNQRLPLECKAQDFNDIKCTGSRGLVASMRALNQAPLRGKLFLLGCVWVGINFGWYGLQLWLPSLFEQAGVDQTLYEDTALTAAANLPGNLVAICLIDRVGRRALLTGGLILATLAGIGMAAARGSVMLVGMACLFNFVSVGAWNALDCISVESFPTAQRATAMALLAATGRLAAVMAQFVNSWLITTSVPLLLVCCAAALGSSAIATMFLTETAGAELDGPNQVSTKPCSAIERKRLRQP